ncbi:MAG: hypothetical protein PWR09_443 [Archaeoglobi archaeon]|nr:hypothetical protein [Archaeoglobi archaeon]
MRFFSSIYESWREIQYEKYEKLELDRRLEKKRVLDAGASCCFLSDFLKERGVRAELISLDSDIQALKRCISERVAGDVSKLPFRDEIFDVIVCMDVLHLSKDLDLRPLRRGGIAIVGVPERHRKILLEWLRDREAEIFEINGREREIVAFVTRP